MIYLLVGLLIFFIGGSGFCLGWVDNGDKLEAANKEISRLRARIAVVQHEYSSVVGLWATDRPNLIKSPRLKSLFYRIGYPKEKL